MTSRKIHFIAAIVLCSLLSAEASVFALSSSSISIGLSGTIKGNQIENFTITGDNTNYAATENGGARTTSGTSLNTVMTTVFGWMSSGQSVAFIGTFTLRGYQTVTKSITMDLTQATLTLTGDVDMYQWRFNAKVTMLGSHKVDIYTPANEYDPPSGGHIIGALTNDRNAILLQNGASNSVFDGIDCKNVGIYTGWMTTVNHVTLQNCIFHDCLGDGSLSGQPIFGGRSGGYHTVQDCRFVYGSTQAHWFAGSDTNCKFLRNEYAYIAGNGGSAHSFYLSGAADQGAGGYHEIAYCIFHDFSNYHGAVQVKSPHNNIHDNIFYNYGTRGVCFSIYSQWSGSQANDNDIYHNTFTDINDAFWIGHGSDSVDPTLRNLIHDNTFTRVNQVFKIPPDPPAAVSDDTKIYYNNFNQCTTIFSSYTPSYTHNTVFAYNYFSGTWSSTQLQSCVNSMSYQNTLFSPSTTLAIPNFNYGPITDTNSYYYVAPRGLAGLTS